MHQIFDNLPKHKIKNTVKVDPVSRKVEITSKEVPQIRENKVHTTIKPLNEKARSKASKHDFVEIDVQDKSQKGKGKRVGKWKIKLSETPKYRNGSWAGADVNPHKRQGMSNATTESLKVMSTSNTETPLFKNKTATYEVNITETDHNNKKPPVPKVLVFHNSTWSAWAAWGQCSVSCGLDGWVSRQRVCIKVAGKPCPEGSNYEQKACEIVTMCPGKKIKINRVSFKLTF